MPVLNKYQIVTKQIAFIMDTLLDAGIQTDITTINVEFEYKYAYGTIYVKITSSPIDINLKPEVLNDVLEFSRIIFRYKKFKTLKLTYKMQKDELDVDVHFSS